MAPELLHPERIAVSLTAGRIIEASRWSYTLTSMRVGQGLQDRFRTRSLFISFQKQLGTDHVVRANDVGAGVGNTAGPSRSVFVADAVGVDRLAAGIGE